MMFVKCDPVAWALTCPACNEEMPAPGGSLMWTAEDLDGSEDVVPGKIRCRGCGAWSRLPKLLAALVLTGLAPDESEAQDILLRAAGAIAGRPVESLEEAQDIIRRAGERRS